MRTLLPVIAILMLGLGCTRSEVLNPTAPFRSDRNAQVRVVLADLEREPDIITEQYQPFFAAMARTMRKEFPRLGVFATVTHQRDLGPDRARERTLYIVYRVTDFSDVVSSNAGQTVNFVFCCLILIPCVWHGAIKVAYETISMSAELRVYDVTGKAPTQVADPRSGARSYVFDTSGKRPILSREYDLRAEAGIGYNSGESAIAFSREFAGELAHQLMAGSARDLESIAR